MGIILAAVGAIASAAASITRSLATIGLALQGVKLICETLVSIGKTLGIIKSDTNPEDLGDKALQAEEEGITPEDYESFEDYVKAIEDFEVDPEKSNLYTEEEKTMKAVEVASGVIVEKYGDEMPLEEFCEVVEDNPEYFSHDQPEKFADIISSGSETVSVVTGVLNGTIEDPEFMKEAVDKMVELELKANPERSEAEVRNEIVQMLLNRK